MSSVKPTFLIIGAEKSGTTSLCDYLSRHSEIFVSSPKETNYFTFKFHEKNIDWYLNHFSHGGDKSILGEGSVSYTFSSQPEVIAKRIHDVLPEVKLIYIVRHPMDRLKSAWLQWTFSDMKRSMPRLSFEERILAGKLIEGSLYWKQLSAFRNYYQDDRFLILFFEELINAPAITYRKCLQFLGARNLDEVPSEWPVHNSHSDRHALTGLGCKVRSAAIRLAPKTHRRLASLLPRAAKKAIMYAFKRRWDVMPARWEEHTWNFAASRIVPDAARFLEYCNKPADYWTFEMRDVGDDLPGRRRA